VKVLQRRLVASEYDVVLGAGIKPALDAFEHRKILIFNSGHQQIELLFQCRLALSVKAGSGV